MPIPSIPSPLASILAAKTYNAAWYSGSTNEAKIAACEAAVKADGALLAYIPANMIPYNGALVPPTSGVKRIREGSDPFVWDLDAYGIAGDGVTDVTAYLQLVENIRPAYETLRGIPGKVYAVNGTYDGTAATRPLLLQMKSAGIWELDLKYNNVLDLTVGNDGGGLGVVNVRASDCRFIGSVDCNAHARYAFVLQDIVGNFNVQAKVTNTLETSGIWSSIYGALSANVTGIVLTGTRAKTISGFLHRPNCPVCNAASVITGHTDVTAILLGSQVVSGNSTGLALVINNGAGAKSCSLACIDTIGIPSFGFAGIGNTFLGDWFCHDLGVNVSEFYGTSQANSDAFHVPQGKRIGSAYKGSAGVIVGSAFYFNDPSGNPDAPNIWMDGGSVAGGGTIDLNPITNAGGVSATAGGKIVQRILPAALSSEALLVSGLDVSQGNSCVITITAARLVGVPVTPRIGQRFKFTFIQGGAGAFAITWNAVFKKIWSDAGNVTGARSSIEFEYDGTNWNQVSAQAAYV